MIEFLENWKIVFLIIHGLAASVGVGGVFVLDVLFFKFLKDFRISHKEKYTLNAISKIFWVALLILILSGLALFLPHKEELIKNSKFLAKMIVVSIIFLNGLFLNLFIGPNLEKVSFHLPHEHKPHELHRYSKLAFISGSISLVSWLTVFILGSIKKTLLSLTEILVIYVVFLILAIIFSIIIEQIFELKSKSKS